MNVNELRGESLRLAVDVEGGPTKAAENWGIPRSTLNSRMKQKEEPLEQGKLPGDWGDNYLDLPDNLEEDEWLDIVKAAGRLTVTTRFWLGDALNYGEQRYGETFAQATAVLPIEPDTLQQYMWVARSIPRSMRRDGVGWSHYRHIASVDDEGFAQDLIDWCSEEQPTASEVKERRDGKAESESPKLDEEWITCPACHGNKKLPPETHDKIKAIIDEHLVVEEPDWLKEDESGDEVAAEQTT